MKLLVILAMFLPMLALALPKESDRQYMDKFRTIVLNPGFEFQQARWSKTGSSTWIMDFTTPLIGARSLNWDASATGEFLASDQVTIPAGLKGRNCQLSVLYSWDSGSSGDIKLQVYDGTNVLAESELGATSGGVVAEENIQFTCPTSGSLGARLASTANAASIEVDEFHLGTSTSVVQLSQAELVADAYYPVTTACEWSTASATIADFGADADCPSITVKSSSYAVDTTDNNLPDIDFDSLPPGRYEVQVQSHAGCPSTATCYYAISDGSTEKNCPFQRVDTEGPYHGCTTTFEYTTSGPRNFKLRGATNVPTLVVDNRQAERTLNWTVKRFPLGSEKAYNLSTQGWYIDANLGGAQPSLGTSSVATYTYLTNASLDLVTNSGSAPTKISCVSGEAPSGSTCTGNESVGIGFTIPKVGAYQACAAFTHQWKLEDAQGTDLYAAFQLCETTSTGVTCTQEGKSRVFSGSEQVAASNEGRMQHATPINVCGIFNFSSAGEKVIRLMYEQLVTGSPALSLIPADRVASLGQRDIHFTVKPINQAAATLVVPNDAHMVVQDASGGQALSTTSYAFNPLQFPAATTDTVSGWDNANDKYVVQKDSYCSISGGTEILWSSAPAANQLVLLGTYKNGSNHRVIATHYTNGSNDRAILTGAKEKELYSSGDEIQLYVRKSDTGAADTAGDATTQYLMISCEPVQ